MKADENAAGAKKRSTKAFYPELAEGKGSFDLLHLLQKAEPHSDQLSFVPFLFISCGKSANYVMIWTSDLRKKP
jgi:hypothetical protein